MAKESTKTVTKHDLKGNAVIFSPIGEIAQYVSPSMEMDEKRAINEIARKLAEKYHFLGEMLFEPKKGPELVTLTAKERTLLNKVMKPHELSLGLLETYSDREDLKRIKQSSVSNKPGTSGRDLVRQELMKMFGSHTLGKTLLPSNTLTFNFKKSADLADSLDAQTEHIAAIETSTAKVIDPAITRELTRAFLDAYKSTLKTDDEVQRLKADETIEITIRDKEIEVRVPLHNEFFTAITSGRMDRATVRDIVAQEVSVGLQAVLQARRNLSL